MSFKKFKDIVKEAIMVSGYTRASKELLLLSDRQLEDLNFSRGLLEQGGKAYPWTLEEQSKSHVAPLNLTELDSNSVEDEAPISPQTPKAA